MVLEATMIVVDNSEASRNGDYPYVLHTSVLLCTYLFPGQTDSQRSPKPRNSSSTQRQDPIRNPLLD